jgi:hypothetical protein
MMLCRLTPSPPLEDSLDSSRGAEGIRKRCYSRDCNMSFLARPSLRYDRSTEMDVRCPWGSSPGGISSSLTDLQTLDGSGEDRPRAQTFWLIHNPRCVPWRLRQRRRVMARSWHDINLRERRKCDEDEDETRRGTHNNAWYSSLEGSVSYRPAWL